MFEGSSFSREEREKKEGALQTPLFNLLQRKADRLSFTKETIDLPLTLLFEPVKSNKERSLRLSRDYPRVPSSPLAFLNQKTKTNEEKTKKQNEKGKKHQLKISPSSPNSNPIPNTNVFFLLP